MAKVKRTTEEQIALLTARLNKLKDKLKSPEKSLDLNTPGMSEAINALKAVSERQGVTLGEVIKSVSRIKRTGLRIADPLPKGRKPKATTVAVVSQ